MLTKLEWAQIVYDRYNDKSLKNPVLCFKPEVLTNCNQCPYNNILKCNNEYILKEANKILNINALKDLKHAN